VTPTLGQWRGVTPRDHRRWSRHGIVLRILAQRLDSRATFYSFGTAAMPKSYKRSGILDK
jgi:hypothetical protein